MIRGLSLRGAGMPSLGLWDSEPIASAKSLFRAEVSAEFLQATKLRLQQTPQNITTNPW